jgi:AAA domain
MFNSIRFVNFFSFADTTISLEPGANILVGINGSGKSTLIFEMDEKKLNQCKTPFNYSLFYSVSINKISSTLNYYVAEALYEFFDAPPLFIEHKPQTITEELLSFLNGTGIIKTLKRVPDVDSNDQVELDKHDDYDAKELTLAKVFDSERYPLVRVVRKLFSAVDVYNYFDTRPGNRMRRPILPTSGQKLLPDGGNLAQILNTIKIQDKKPDWAIRDLLSQINGHFATKISRPAHMIPDLCSELQRLTKGTKKKGYHKVRDTVALLPKLDLAALCVSFTDVNNLIARLFV